MGLAKKILKGIETKLDGPARVPPHEWAPDQAWARLVASERNPDRRGDPNQSGAPSLLDDVIGKAAGTPYRFELEVHRPDQAGYSVTRTERVPTRVEGTLFLESHSIPAGAEVPLQIRGPGKDDFDLDWDAYLAIPEQKARAHHLRLEAQQELMRKLEAEGRKR